MESKIEDEKQNKHSYEKKRWKEAGSYTLLKEMKKIWGRCDDFPVDFVIKVGKVTVKAGRVCPPVGMSVDLLGLEEKAMEWAIFLCLLLTS